MQQTVSFRVAYLTPEDAKRMEAQFYADSRVNQRMVQTYADDMARGRWQLNGAPIVLAANGKVLDGRIRVLACIKSCAPFPTLIIEGIDPNGFETIDAVRKRTLSDVLTMRSEKHGRALAAGLRVIWGLLNNGKPMNSSISPIALLTLLEQYPEIRSSVSSSLIAAPLLPHGVGIAMHFLFGMVKPALRDKFFHSLSEGITENEEDDPASMLKQALKELAAKGGSRNQDYIIAITTKAWNALSKGKQIKLLKFDPEREEFPKIADLHINQKEERYSTNGTTGSSTCTTELPELSVHIEMVTPEKAQTLLERNKNNRNVSASVIQKYARDMAAGKWHLNGQTIKISSDGQLLDGQHRLQAGVRARKPFPAIVVEGLDKHSYESLDVGRKRGMSDILKEYGESHTATLASALRWLWIIENNVVLSSKISPTNSEMLDLLNRHPGVRDSVKAVGNSMRDMMGTGLSSALHHVFSQIDKNMADTFFRRLADGTELGSSEPVYHLRERLIKNKDSHRVRIAEAERLALTIKAWNSTRAERPMQVLAWRTRGTSRESIPIPA